MDTIESMVRADLRTEAEDEYAWLRRTAAAAQGVLNDYAAAQGNEREGAQGKATAGQSQRGPQPSDPAGSTPDAPAAAAPDACDICCGDDQPLQPYRRSSLCPDCLSAAREHDAVLEDAQREYGSAGHYGPTHGPLDGCEPR